MNLLVALARQSVCRACGVLSRRPDSSALVQRRPETHWHRSPVPSGHASSCRDGSSKAVFAVRQHTSRAAHITLLSAHYSLLQQTYIKIKKKSKSKSNNVKLSSLLGFTQFPTRLRVWTLLGISFPSLIIFTLSLIFCIRHFHFHFYKFAYVRCLFAGSLLIVANVHFTWYRYAVDE